MILTSAVLWGLAAVAVAGAAGCAESGARVEHAGEDPEPRAYAADVADAAHVRANLTAARTRQGRAPALTFVAAELRLRAARAQILAGQSPRDVLDDQLQLAADNSERDIAYWSTEVRSLDDIQFPAKLVKTARLSVAIMVARAPHTDAPPRYFVLFAMAEPDQSD